MRFQDIPGLEFFASDIVRHAMTDDMRRFHVVSKVRKVVSGVRAKKLIPVPRNQLAAPLVWRPPYPAIARRVAPPIPIVLRHSAPVALRLLAPKCKDKLFASHHGARYSARSCSFLSGHCFTRVPQRNAAKQRIPSHADGENAATRATRARPH